MFVRLESQSKHFQFQHAVIPGEKGCKPPKEVENVRRQLIHFFVFWILARRKKSYTLDLRGDAFSLLVTVCHWGAPAGDSNASMREKNDLEKIALKKLLCWRRLRFHRLWGDFHNLLSKMQTRTNSLKLSGTKCVLEEWKNCSQRGRKSPLVTALCLFRGQLVTSLAMFPAAVFGGHFFFTTGTLFWFLESGYWACWPRSQHPRACRRAHTLPYSPPSLLSF